MPSPRTFRTALPVLLLPLAACSRAPEPTVVPGPPPEVPVVFVRG